MLVCVLGYMVMCRDIARVSVGVMVNARVMTIFSVSVSVLVSVVGIIMVSGIRYM